jgi:GNAT superfamily N-acetyltransferase
MKVRKAVPGDEIGIAKVQVDSWKTTYENIIPGSYLKQMTYESREQQWKDIISDQAVFVAENPEGEIVGFSNGGRERTGNYPGYDGELYAIYILKAYQRKGLGKLLLKPLFQDLVQKGIFSVIVLVLEENDSRLFYESLGARILDTVQLEIAGKKLNELVYGWEDIRELI